MQQLMISLDKNILNKDSRVARRMIEYGKKDELFIIIPHSERQKFDLSDSVHVVTTGGNKIQQFFRLKKLGKKIIKDSKFKIQDSFITTQDPFFIGLVGLWLKRQTKTKLEVQVHGDFFGGYYKRQLLKQFIARLVIKQADKIRVVGKRVKKSLIDRGVSEDKIYVQSVSIDIEQDDGDDLHTKYQQYKKIFLVLGRVEPVKNVGWLVDIFQELDRSDFLLLIVGRGSGRKELESKVRSLASKVQIKFEDWAEGPYDYLKTVDCVLFPSLSEGYGLVPMEAHALGTPVIMNDVGVANYELLPSEKVKIIPISDKQAWIDAILNI